MLKSTTLMPPFPVGKVPLQWPAHNIWFKKY